jgi:hypothetical protein
VLTKGIKYCKWTCDDMMKHQLQFYMAITSIKAFYKANLVNTRIPEKTFGIHWRLSGLKGLQESNAAFEMAKVAIEHHVALVKRNAASRILNARQHKLLAGTP